MCTAVWARESLMGSSLKTALPSREPVPYGRCKLLTGPRLCGGASSHWAVPGHLPVPSHGSVSHLYNGELACLGKVVTYPGTT